MDLLNVLPLYIIATLLLLSGIVQIITEKVSEVSPQRRRVHGLINLLLSIWALGTLAVNFK